MLPAEKILSMEIANITLIGSSNNSFQRHSRFFPWDFNNNQVQIKQQSVVRNRFILLLCFKSTATDRILIYLLRMKLHCFLMVWIQWNSLSFQEWAINISSTLLGIQMNSQRKLKNILELSLLVPDKVGDSKKADRQKEAVTSLSLHYWCSLL